MKRLVVGILVLGAVGAAGAAWYWPRNRSDTLRLPGTVEVQEVRLGSKTGGRVIAVYANESETAEPGKVLVTLETDELTARRDRAKAKLSTARANLDKANNGPLDEEIAEAEALAKAAKARLVKARTGFREEQKRQAEHELAAALADLRQTDEEYSKVRQLRTAGAGALADFDNAKAGRDRAQSRVNAAQAALDLVTTGTRPEEIDEAEADLARYEARWKLLRRGTRDEDKAAARAAVAEAEAELAEAEVNLRESVVLAPERCRVEVVSVRPGDLVPAGRSVVLAHRTGDLWVKVFVPSTDLGKLRLGQAVEVAVDSHPGKRFPGEVIHIATSSEFTPRNVQSVDERRHQVFAVKVRVTDPGGVFKSGMAAEVFVPLSE
jgi:multidrug resistance efflux pump